MPTRLDLSYQAAARQVRARVQTFLLGRFAAGQYRDADLDRFVAAVVPVVLAGQRQISSLTDAYLSVVLSNALGHTVRSAAPSSTYPRGVDPAEVYARPFITIWTALKAGKAFDDAKAEGIKRLRDLSATDMQLAKTHTARDVFARTGGFHKFRRTLSGPVNCALCAVASTQVYFKEDLLPIHPGCDCGVEPVIGDFDADAELEATHDAIASRFGQQAVDRGGRNPLDYRKAILVRDHGEIGPVLTLREHQFTGPSAI